MAVAATDEKVSSSIHIHDDIARPILSKLPLKSLKRFGCVCKSWSLLFQNPYFMSMYRNEFISNHRSLYYDATFLLFLCPHWRFPTYLYSFSANRIKLLSYWPNPFIEVSYVVVDNSGSINGTLCLRDRNHELLVLSNPTTKKFKVIPPSPYVSSSSSVHLHGFGYDHVRDNYKVIRHVELRRRLPNSNARVTLWEIYSLRSNSWSKLAVDHMPLFHARPGSDNIQVYTDGVCHWLYEDFKHNYISACLVSFDFGSEVFFNTPICFDIDDSFCVGVSQRDLVALNGSIGLISYHGQPTTFHISILGELGVKESWTKLFIVGPLPWVDRFIGFGKKGEIFFRRKDKELVLFDLSTQMVEELGVKGWNDNCKIVIYKESHLPINRRNR